MVGLKSGIRWGVILSALTGVYGNTTLVRVDTSSSQALMRIRTDQTGSCTVNVSTTNNFGSGYTPIHDVNTAYFSGSDQCSRVDNLVNGNVYTLVIGKRAAELASDGIHRYSRSLKALTTYYYSISVGGDTLTGSFRTDNVPLGNTRNDARFDRLRPGEYAYPSIDWSDKTKEYVDPHTGVGVKRLLGPGELFPLTVTGRLFSSTEGGLGWSGTTWIGTGVGSRMFLRAADPSPTFTVYQSIDAVRLVVDLSGTAPAAEVCLTNDGVTCAGGTITQAINGTPTTYTIGSTTPILDSWRNSPNIPSTFVDMQPRTGNVTKSGSVVTWTSGALFNLRWGPGSTITLGGTDCTIASVTHEKALGLSSSGCVADGSYAFTGRNWGFLLRATGTGTLAVSSPTWTSIMSGTNQGGSSGIPKLCSSVKVNGPTGPGQVCSGAGGASEYFSANPILWIGDDGTANLIGPSYVNVGSTGLASGACAGEGLVWDSVVAAKYWCLGSVSGAPVLYSVRYTGDYNAVIPVLDGAMGLATVTVESGNLNTLVSNFTANDPVHFSDFASAFGWRLVANQGGRIILENFMVGQESPGWIAVFDMATSSIIGAMPTYGGGRNATNRWCGLHTLNIGGDTDWVFLTCNPSSTPYTAAISSGGLTSTYVACPSNTVDSSLAGQPRCSQITLATVTPTYLGSSLFSQTFLEGDEAIVWAGGAVDNEIVRFLTLSGTTAYVQRNARPTIFPYYLKQNHTGMLSLQGSPGAWHEYWWNFVDDPHAQSLTMPYGKTIREDPTSSNCHEVFENDVFLEGCVRDREFSRGKIIRLGALPSNFDEEYFRVDLDAPFHNSTFAEGANYLEQHPSIGQRTAADYEKPIWMDNRPYAGNPNVTGSGNVTQVTGDVYKVAASATVDLNYREQGFVGLAGATPLVDVSPAVISDITGDAFKFCYVLIAGDCYAGSTVGEIYFNVPKLTSTAVVVSRFVNYPDNLQRDITFTQNTFTFQFIVQGKAISQDLSGSTIRRLTTGFGPAKIQSQYWNSTALPDNSRAIWVSSRVEMARDETLMLEMPPWPVTQSKNRGAFVPVALTVSGVSGDTVRVRFGYAENGAATDLYCHERQSACGTDATGVKPFVWTDETQNWTTCDTGCTVNIPAISGRVLYYVVDRKNGSSTVAGGLEAVLIP